MYIFFFIVSSQYVFSFSNIRVRSVCCGHFHTFVISQRGSLYGFGLADNARLGRHDIGSKRRRIVSLPQMIMKGRVESVSTGLHHSLVIRKDHDKLSRSVYACGLNTVGQLGIGEEKEEDDDDTGIHFTRIELVVEDDKGKDEFVSRLEDFDISMVSCGAYHSAVALRKKKVRLSTLLKAE